MAVGLAKQGSRRLLFIVKSFRLLRQHKPWKLVLIFAITLVNGVSSGFSIVLLIPLLHLLDVNSGEQSNRLAVFFKNVASKTGIEPTIETILLVYLVLLTVMPLLQYWKSLLDARYQQTFIYQLRRRLFRKIILADWTLLNHKSKNNHLQVLTKEVPNMAAYYYFYLRMIMTMLFMGSYIAWAMLISGYLTIAIVIAGGLLFFILRKFLVKAFHLSEGFVKSYNQLLKYIDDFWQTVKIAKVHSSEDFYYQKFDEANSSLLDLEYQMQKNHALPQLIYRIAGILVLVMVVYTGYNTGFVPLASLFILILLFSRVFPQFISLNSNINNIIITFPSVRMVMQLDDEFSDTLFHANETTPGVPVEKEITLKGISFSYPGEEQLFREFSEVIPAKRITGIVGVSGRGKTTLIDIIAGLQGPETGQIYADGRLLNDEVLPSWRKSIGYLPQDSFFIEGTLRENLVWDSRSSTSDDRIMEVLDQVNAIHLVNRFKKGLDEHIVNYQFMFSGGERQRLALARALLREPRILLLDEATSSLDAENERQVMEVITKLKEQVTILFVTHRRSLLPYFDKIIQLDDHLVESSLSGMPEPHTKLM
nr:ABC transporter ATP-binding protein [Sunxiuqinia sp.]